ncbi:hypothetical protein [Billgrantia sulfidoxydans]|nr:hypothetical protein [Halomonas sulfidoxydans]
MSRVQLVRLVALLALGVALALVWRGWQNADASLLLFGTRLC